MRWGARCRPGGGRARGGGGAGGMHEEGPTQGLGARARAERTVNMPNMVVTLEVSKLSGWLNAYVDYRVEGRGMRCGSRCAPGGGRAWGGGGASGVHGEVPTQGLGGRARAERTWNMSYMFVTPDVSQLEMSALKFLK
jgi:hypothetical protein